MTSWPSLLLLVAVVVLMACASPNHGAPAPTCTGNAPQPGTGKVDCWCAETAVDSATFCWNYNDYDELEYQFFTDDFSETLNGTIASTAPVSFSTKNFNVTSLIFHSIGISIGNAFSLGTVRLQLYDANLGPENPLFAGMVGQFTGPYPWLGMQGVKFDTKLVRTLQNTSLYAMTTVTPPQGTNQTEVPVWFELAGTVIYNVFMNMMAEDEQFLPIMYDGRNGSVVYVDAPTPKNSILTTNSSTRIISISTWMRSIGGGGELQINDDLFYIQEWESEPNSEPESEQSEASTQSVASGSGAQTNTNNGKKSHSSSSSSSGSHSHFLLYFCVFVFSVVGFGTIGIAGFIVFAHKEKRTQYDQL